MAITFPLTLPTATGIAHITWRAVRADILSGSPLTFAQQVIQHQGQRWEADINLPSMKRELAEEWIGFFLQLDGRSGTFLLTPPEADTPRGAADGTPVINGASQTGSELNIDGLSISTTGYLLAGDFIQLGTGSTTRLHKVVQDVASDGAGAATLDIWPKLRESPTDGSTVVVSGASGLFRLDRPVADWSINDTSSFGISFGATEAM